MATTKIDTSTVTSEQLDRAARIIGPDNKVFYLVLSESDNETEYRVEYHNLPTKHFTCTCKAGQNGFANCKQGTCKHVKWAVAHAEEVRATEKALAERILAEQEQAAKQAKLDKIRRLVEKGLTHPQALQAAETYTTLDEDALVRVFRAPVRKGPKPRNDTRVFSLTR